MTYAECKQLYMRSRVGIAIDWMREFPLHPDEVVAIAQVAASLFRAGPQAIERYFKVPTSCVGTDGETCP